MNKSVRARMTKMNVKMKNGADGKAICRNQKTSASIKSGSRSSVTQRMRTRIVTSKKSTMEAKKSFHIEIPNQVAHMNPMSTFRAVDVSP